MTVAMQPLTYEQREQERLDALRREALSQAVRLATQQTQSFWDGPAIQAMAERFFEFLNDS